MRSSLPVVMALDDIRVASPCAVAWDGMAGDDRARFCSECQQHVYNLSAMTTEQALALLHEKEVSVCVRLYRRWDGTVLTADCPFSLRQLVRRPGRWLVAGLAALLALIVPGLGGCTQGKMCRPTPTEKETKGQQPQEEGGKADQGKQ